MADDFLKAEETIANLLKELSKIKSANNQINELENISKEATRIADIANRTSTDLISKAQNLVNQIEKAKLETNLKFITDQLAENKKSSSKNRTLLIVLIILQLVVLSFLLITKLI